MSETTSRRSFVSISGATMTVGLVAGYGTLSAIAGQYLYPRSGPNVRWQFVAIASRLKLGESLAYTAPNGAKVVIARQQESPAVDDDIAENFIALSSVCPHLGCQVHWKSQDNRFFCPCHNGVFDPQGKPLEGPPAKANQQLVRFPLRLESGMLFIEAPMDTLVRAEPHAECDMIAHSPSVSGPLPEMET